MARSEFLVARRKLLEMCLKLLEIRRNLLEMCPKLLEICHKLLEICRNDRGVVGVVRRSRSSCAEMFQNSGGAAYSEWRGGRCTRRRRGPVVLNLPSAHRLTGCAVGFTRAGTLGRKARAHGLLDPHR